MLLHAGLRVDDLIRWVGAQHMTVCCTTTTRQRSVDTSELSDVHAGGAPVALADEHPWNGLKGTCVRTCEPSLADKLQLAVSAVPATHLCTHSGIHAGVAALHL